jgi:very-short-patch-repair endonuclease
MRAGQRHSEKSKAKMSAAKIGNKNSLGHKHPEESRAKMSAASVGNKGFLGHRHTEDTKVKVSASRMGQGLTEETKAKIAAAKVDWWGRFTLGERRERTAPAMEASQRANPSSLEKVVCQVLDALGIVYETQLHMGNYYVDMFIRSKDLILECDGNYWHSRPGRAENDRQRDLYLSGLGYRVIHLPEQALLQDPRLAVLRSIGP